MQDICAIRAAAMVNQFRLSRSRGKWHQGVANIDFDLVVGSTIGMNFNAQ